MAKIIKDKKIGKQVVKNPAFQKTLLKGIDDFKNGRGVAMNANERPKPK